MYISPQNWKPINSEGTESTFQSLTDMYFRPLIDLFREWRTISGFGK